MNKEKTIKFDEAQEELKKSYAFKIRRTHPNSNEEDKIANEYTKERKSLFLRFFF